MRRIALLATVFVPAPALVGCQGARAGYSLLSLIGLSQKPLVVSLVIEKPEENLQPERLINPFSQYDALFAAMGKTVGRKVVPDLCFTFQAAPNLALGVTHFAVVSPLHFAELKQLGAFEPVAFMRDEQGRAARPALLIAAASGPIERVEDLRGKRVAFGPLRDGRTSHAALLLLLRQRGLNKADLSLEVLPIPGSLKRFPNGRAVAMSVIHSSSDAGFIDEAVWESFPDAGGDGPAKDRLRVIDRTAPTPNQLVVASPRVERDTIDRVASFLAEVGETAPDALRPLQAAGFAPPDDELLSACLGLLSGAPPVEASPTSAPAP